MEEQQLNRQLNINFNRNLNNTNHINYIISKINILEKKLKKTEYEKIILENSNNDKDLEINNLDKKINDLNNKIENLQSLVFNNN